MEEFKYYDFKEILKFLGFDYEFEKENPQYPFNRGRDNVVFSWGQVLIPKYGIMEMVQNKISEIGDRPITEIKMMYQIPFLADKGVGLINQDIQI